MRRGRSVGNPSRFAVSMISPNRILRRALWAVLFACAGTAYGAIRVVATTSDLKSLAEAIGGEKVEVEALVSPKTDPEEYQPRPQDLARLKAAQMLVRVGVDFDLWVDRLALQAANPAIRRGGAGHVDASYGITLLDVRGAQVGPSGGHAHGSGNPHYWLDPLNAEMITASIMEALLRLDAPNAAYYQQRRTAFLAALHARLSAWQQALAPLKGVAFIAYHNDWSYFARRFRLHIAGYIEPRPGVPPTPAHLAAIVNLARERRVRAVLRQPHEPHIDADFVAARAGAAVVQLAASVGAVGEARDYLSLFDYNIATLAAFAR